ncbi:MAG: phosphatidate cytidylyltransferase [Acidimicrobiales bacterium]
MARENENEAVEHTGHGSGRVRIIGAEPAGLAAARGEREAAGDEPVDAFVTPPLPHWTEPPTGEVPAILSSARDVDDPYSSVPGPTWREEGNDWDDTDEGFEPSMLAGDKVEDGALSGETSDRQPWVFDLPGEDDPGASIFDEEPAWDRLEPWDDLASNGAGSPITDEAPITEVIPVTDPSESTDHQPELEDHPLADQGPAVQIQDLDEPARSQEPLGQRRSRLAKRAAPSAPPRPRVTRRPSSEDSTLFPGEPATAQTPGRNVAAALISGVVLGAIALIVFKIGPIATVTVLTIVVTVAAMEAYAAFRQGGYHPVTLLGLVATASLLIATYNRGTVALPLVTVLLIGACFVWHLARVENTDTVHSIGTTVFVFGWIAIFGSFGALLVSPGQFSGRHGIAYLLGGLIAGVASDVGALGFGAWIGRHPMSSLSPNKTWEGFAGGILTAVVVSAAIVHLVHPWTVGKAALLGLVVSIVCSLGDLFESAVKRHLGRKDMGRLLPGHGGLLDRIDGLLFVLPATYYLVIAFHLR